MDIVLRPAAAADIPAIVALLADDELGALRESPEDLAPYLAAFREIDADAHQLLAVAEAVGTAEVVGTLQLTFLPGLSHRGGLRAQIAAVRVRSAERGAGLGSRMIEWAVDVARERGAMQVQLTSNAAREDAHRFYARLGFEASHVGFKRKL
jgi:GNAT superfamily N-acetyltransferase